jgi:hypothetical protein
MNALSCPKCGAPVHAGVQVCPYCGVGLVNDLPQNPGERPQPPVQVPEGWVRFQDLWHGFTLAHPPGWRVETFQGQISIREDPVGIVAAMIWPYSLPAPASARQTAFQFAGLARTINPTFQVWQQENAAFDSNRITLRTHQVRYGQPVEGCLNVLVDGTNAVISGYEAPAPVIAQHSAVLSAILATFRTGELMPRQRIQETAEGAFSGSIPAGWMFQAGVKRTTSGGAGLPYLSAACDPQAQVWAGSPWYTWAFMDGGFGGFGNFLGGMGGYSAMRFAPAAAFCQSNIAPWMGQAQAGFRVEAIVDRPDLTDRFIQVLAKAGYPPSMFEVTAAVIETSYTENGVQMRQKSRVGTQRQRAGVGTVMGSAPLWTAYLDEQYHAPESEFAAWEPVLQGVLDAVQVNPAWKASERQRIQGMIAATQQDMMRRTQQISQTLRETSEIITNSYWNRQATYDHIAEVRSDAIRGVHNEASSAGEVFKVPNGFDRYWMDGLGNFYGGSWMTQPEIHWTPLEPAGR